MSDYDDYENNLFFEPIGDMSKLNDCNDGKRSVDVLVTTIEKCQKIVHENVELKNKLEIARKALEFYAEMKHIDNIVACSNIENHCYCEGDIENGHTAAEALEKIKEKKDDIQK